MSQKTNPQRPTDEYETDRYTTDTRTRLPVDLTFLGMLLGLSFGFGLAVEVTVVGHEVMLLTAGLGWLIGLLSNIYRTDW